MIWVLAFLVTPGFILLIQLFPAFQAAVIRAGRFGMPGLVWKIPSVALNNPDTVGWLPTAWFLGLFERVRGSTRPYFMRSEEHTSELQSQSNLVCRLLLEKKNKI